MIVSNLSPILISAGPLAIRWYSVLFACGIILDYFLTRWLFRKRGWPVDDFDLAAVFLFVGMVVGARLGEVFFYNFDYYMSAPLEIFKVWKGGLASHGAAVGVLVAYTAFWWWKRRGDSSGSAANADDHADVTSARFKFAKYADVLVIGMPIVAGFVRIGNFFNSEILGRPSDLPWAVVFARVGDNVARHPSQIYEALLAWAVFGILIWLWIWAHRGDTVGRFKKFALRPYFFLFLFVGLYFSTRFFVEFFKEFTGSDAVNAGWFGLTMGQWLSVVPVLIAIGWFGWRIKKGAR